jgi:hypothetical protein
MPDGWNTLLAMHSSWYENLCWPPGTSILRWSLQDYSAKVNILGQPTAVTCSYKRLAVRSSHTLWTECRYLMDWRAVWGGFHWTAINLPHTCLMSSRLQWRSMKWRHTLQLFSRQKPGTHEYTAPGGLPTELCMVVPTIWGSWVQNLVHVTHLAHGI